MTFLANSTAILEGKDIEDWCTVVVSGIVVLGLLIASRHGRDEAAVAGVVLGWMTLGCWCWPALLSPGSKGPEMLLMVAGVVLVQFASTYDIDAVHKV
jgi:hypothetical protein